MTIRNDATRLRIPWRDERRPRSVVSRQGQVLLDTDFDQQSQHLLDRIETETVDTLGSPNRLTVPADEPTGFAISMPGGAPAGLDIGAGHGYLRGWLLHNPAPRTLATQPHSRVLPPIGQGIAQPDAIAAPAIVAIKALIRHVDPAEDTALADSALGDAQSSGRSLIDWQVFPLPVDKELDDCEAALADQAWVAVVAPSMGTIAVSVAAAGPNADPCSLTPAGGFSRLENLLYRVEVHGGEPIANSPTADGPRFGITGLKLKLSRRNASLMVRITASKGAELTVSPPALDHRNWFAPGTYAEIVSPHDDVDPRAALQVKRMFSVAQSSDDRVTLATVPADLPLNTGEWFLRLWDSVPGSVDGIVTVAAPAANGDAPSTDLGDGLSLVVGGGANATFRRGDYWTFAARADGTIDWPAGAASPPHGPDTRYALLGILHSDGTLSDCRVPFASLTERTLHYRGGDGQSLSPEGGGFKKLSGRLRVAVLRGKTPVPGAKLHWSAHGGSPDSQIEGTLLSVNGVDTQTDASGLSEVTWSIDAGKADVVHQVEVALLDSGKAGVPPLVFSATFNLAKNVGYTPNDCQTLAKVHNVQDALDALCAAQIATDKLPTVIKASWENNGFVDLATLSKRGLTVAFNEDIDSFCQGVDGIFTLQMEPLLGTNEIDARAYHPLIIPGQISWAKNIQATYVPMFDSKPAFDALKRMLDNCSYPVQGSAKAIRCRVTLTGNGHFAANSEKGRRRYLNGNVLLEKSKPNPPCLGFAYDGDGNIAAARSLGPHDFRSWFYLVEKIT